MPAIHENLKHLRLARGLTQADVAEAIHVTRQTVSGYELGRAQPDLETLGRLAQLYQTDLNGILYGGDRYQRHLRALRRSAWAIAAVVLLGLLVRSALLWAANRYLAITDGQVMTDGVRPIWEARVTLLRAAQGAGSLAGGLSGTGALFLLGMYAALDRPLPWRTRAVCLLGFIAVAFAVTLPWAWGDSVYGYGDYLFVLWGVLAAAMLVFALSLPADLVIRRRSRS